MVPLTADELASVRHLLPPERPGPLVAQHVFATGFGVCLADRWPQPRTLVVETGGNFTLAGDADALRPRDLIGRLAGFIEAPAPFVNLLRAAFDDVREWSRMIFTIDGPQDPAPAALDGVAVRRLGPRDAGALAGLGPDSRWISETWGGATGLAVSGTAWGAFVGERLAAVCCPFFVGDRYEDLGVVTEPTFRGRGHSMSCAAAVCQDVRRRGHTPTWTTSPDNAASLRVAAKLGATLCRHDRLYVVGVPIPRLAHPADHRPG